MPQPTDDEIRNDFACHEVREVISRSWTVQRPGTWNLGFKITWTPGLLHLGGDIGEITFTHYHALSELDGAIAWVGNANFDYLMSKSDAERVYDKQKTIATLASLANEQALEVARNLRVQVRDMAPEFAFERLLAAGVPEDAAELKSEIPEPQDVRAARKHLQEADARQAEGPRGQDWRELAYQLWEGLADAALCRQEDAYSAAGRREIRKRLAHHLEHHHAAAELCHELGLDDYHGSTSWDTRRRMQVAGLKLWARRMQDADADLAA